MSHRIMYEFLLIFISDLFRLLSNLTVFKIRFSINQNLFYKILFRLKFLLDIFIYVIYVLEYFHDFLEFKKLFIFKNSRFSIDKYAEIISS